MLTDLILYLLIGSFTGVLAGLFGVGGGTIIVPAMILTLTAQGVSAVVLTHIAIGTSLAAISVTSISSVHAHHQRQAVLWPTAWQLVPGVCVGVWTGATIASHLSGTVLQKSFGVFLVVIAVQMGLNLQPRSHAGESAVMPKRPVLWITGGIIGLLSAVFGIGGGSLTVPFLSWHGVRMQNAVATAAAVGFPIALVGAAAFVWHGWGNTLLPAASSGFVYWPAFAGIAVTSIGFAKLGAQMAHMLDAQKLKRLFALFLFALGIYFLIRR